jgi:hypothetical protein
MPWMGFEPTIPVVQRAKTVRALDCAATVTGICVRYIADIQGRWAKHVYKGKGEFIQNFDKEQKEEPMWETKISMGGQC